MTTDDIKEVVTRTLKDSLSPEVRIIEIQKIKGGMLNYAYRIQISTSRRIKNIISKFYLDLDKVKLQINKHIEHTDTHTNKHISSVYDNLSKQILNQL